MHNFMKIVGGNGSGKSFALEAIIAKPQCRSDRGGWLRAKAPEATGSCRDIVSRREIRGNGARIAFTGTGAGPIAGNSNYRK